MYEIWLALNILFELACSLRPLPILLLLAVAGLFAVALIRRGAAWRRGLGFPAGVWVAAAMLFLAALPALTKASISDVAYVVDWLNLVAIAAGLAALLALPVWPLSATLMRERAGR